MGTAFVGDVFAFISEGSELEIMDRGREGKREHQKAEKSDRKFEPVGRNCQKNF